MLNPFKLLQRAKNRKWVQAAKDRDTAEVTCLLDAGAQWPSSPTQADGSVAQREQGD